MNIKNIGFVILFVVCVFITGCKQQECKQKIPVMVKVEKVHKTILDGHQSFTGTVEETIGTNLSFSVPGTVTGIRVTAGQRVAKGALIATLDESSAKSSYESASAALGQAQDAYSRMKQLHESNSLPEIQWVQVQSQLQQAQSAEQIARKNLADCRLVAPFSGVIASKDVETGHNVMPGMTVAKLVSVNQVKIKISVPENEVSQINIGQPVNISVSALGGKTFNGKIVEKGISANAMSRSYDIKAIVDNPGCELMPGMICTLFTGKEQRIAEIVVPANIIQTDNENRTFVWVNENGKAAKKFVTVGSLTKEGISIISGLKESDEIIVSGQQKVSSGMAITVEK